MLHLNPNPVTESWRDQFVVSVTALVKTSPEGSHTFVARTFASRTFHSILEDKTQQLILMEMIRPYMDVMNVQRWVSNEWKFWTNVTTEIAAAHFCHLLLHCQQLTLLFQHPVSQASYCDETTDVKLTTSLWRHHAFKEPNYGWNHPEVALRNLLKIYTGWFYHPILLLFFGQKIISQPFVVSLWQDNHFIPSQRSDHLHITQDISSSQTAAASQWHFHSHENVWLHFLIVPCDVCVTSVIQVMVVLRTWDGLLLGPWRRP